MSAVPREWKETSRHTALDVSLCLASPACTAAQPRAPCSRPSNAMNSVPALPWVADWPHSSVLFLRHPNHVLAGWPVPSSPRGAGTRGWKGFVTWGPLGKVGLSSGSPCSAQAAWPANSYSTSPWPGIQRQTRAGLRAAECRGFRVGERLAQASRGGRAAFLSSQVCSRAAIYHEQEVFLLARASPLITLALSSVSRRTWPVCPLYLSFWSWRRIGRWPQTTLASYLGFLKYIRLRA